MNARHGLPSQALSKIAGVLARFPQVEKAVLFGSRAKATHRPGSDIDLALIGPALDWRIVGKIYDQLDDLLLPYRFSLIVHDARTDAEVAAHISRVGVVLFDRSKLTAELRS